MNLAVLETYTMMSLLAFGYLLTLVFLLAYRGLRSVESRALSYFMASRLLHGIGWVLITYRGDWSDLFTVYGGNIALLSGLAFESIAFITHRRQSRKVERAYLGMLLAGSLLFVIFARTPTLIIAVGATAGVVLSSATAGILLRRSKQTVLVRFVGILFGVLSVSFFIRALYGFVGTLEFSISQDTVQSIFYLPVFSLLLAGSTAMVLLLKEEDERALRESHEKYDALFRSNPSAVFLSDPEAGTILEANPQCFELTGYTEQEIQGRTFTELGLWPPGEREKAEAVYRQQGRLLNHEVTARRKDGEERTWLVSSGVAHLGDRSLLASTIQDISERKALENRIHGLLSEQDLLLREVHHRVRNNFSQISSLLSLQAQRTTEQSAAAALGDAVNRIGAMLALYDQVYTGAGDSSVRIRDFLHLLIERLRTAFPALEHITVTLDIDDLELSPRIVSPLGQMVNELFTNSMKYAFQDRSGGAIRISLSRVVGETVLFFEYEDDGPGVSSTGEAAAGDGFGTMLIEALAEQLNAAWDIEGPPGTRYWFRFNADF